MHIHRTLKDSLTESLQKYSVTFLIGPHQCGKSVLAKDVVKNFPDIVYLDLERPANLQKLDDAEWFLSAQKDKLVCVDGIQRKPELLPLLINMAKERNRAACFMVLIPASEDLLKLGEHPNGLISYNRLTPLLWKELPKGVSTEKYFEAGGFPRSLLAANADESFEWRVNFISMFLERDLLQWTGFSSTSMRRLWQMLAYTNGQPVNYSALAGSLGVSSATVKHYIALLEGTFMVETLPPYVSKTGKRLVKAPKAYISDSGIAAALLGLRDFAELSGHPSFGGMWECVVLSNLKGCFPEAAFYYYRTSNGAEISIVMEIGSKVFAVECKPSLSPNLTKGNINAIEDIEPAHTFVAAPVRKGQFLRAGVDLVSPGELENKIREKIG